MPTRAGKLRTGDRIKAPTGDVFVVIDRTGNDADYAVRIRREDGKPFRMNGRLDAQHLLLNPAWLLRTADSAIRWTLVQSPTRSVAGATYAGSAVLEASWDLLTAWDECPIRSRPDELAPAIGKLRKALED